MQLINNNFNSIMREGKLIAGFKSLFKGVSDYQYEFSPTHSYTCNIKQIYQQQLRARYPEITMEQIVKEFQQFLTLPEELLGKRSSEILISSSRRFCCKLIDEQTLNKFMEISMDLWKHFDQNPNTYLVDIYRIFKVQSSKPNFRQVDYFILMPSLRPSFEDIISMYDIKGHCEGRQISHKDFKIFKFGKDQNLSVCNELNLVHEVNKQIKINFLKKFINDVAFLESKKIIDYSLLLSFRKVTQFQQKKAKNCIQIAKDILMQWIIIDYLQQYNAKKKAQNKFKLMFKKQVSSVEPQLYAERFIKFIEKHFQIL